MRVLVLCLIASLAVEATAQTKKPPAKPPAPAKPATADAKPAHFSATGLNNEDDFLRLYAGDFQSVRLDPTGTEFMANHVELHERLRHRLQAVSTPQQS
jgi:hypothetical protein